MEIKVYSNDNAKKLYLKLSKNIMNYI